MTKEHGPIELRAAQVVAVDPQPHGKREIELIAVPYDQWTPVEYRGRIVEESVAPGAFGAIGNRARKFDVFLEHDDSEWVGKVTQLDADDPQGLRAVVLIRNSRREVLDDAADGMLGASVGMAVSPRDQTWEDGGRRRIIRKAYLDHIALTKQPAYAGAEVLDVRSRIAVARDPAEGRTSRTPNLDALRARIRLEDYGSRLT